MIQPKTNAATLLLVGSVASAAGLALRLVAVRSVLGVMDADEAVVGLMARDWLAGRGTVFFWGQNYSGSQESLLVALVYLVLPGAAIAAKTVPVALHAAGAVLVWRIGQRIAGAAAGVVAAALFWLWPAAFVWWSLKARGHYGSTLVLSLVALLLVLRLADDEVRRPHRRLLAAAFGIAAGLGWWASFHVVLLVAPAAIWLVLRRRRAVVVDLGWAVPGAIVGALPWLAWNALNSFASFRQPPVVDAAPPYVERVHAFVTDAFPKATGATVPFSGEWVAPVVGPAILTLVAGAIVVTAAAAIRRRDHHLGLLVATVVCYPLLLAISPFFYVAEPRYLYYLAPVLALAVARWIAPPSASWAVAVLVLASAAVLSAATLQTMASQRMGLFTTGGVAVPRDLDPLLQALQARDIEHAFAPYAMAYRITLESEGSIAATPVEHVRDNRLNEAVRQSARPAWVFMASSTLASDFETAAARRGVEPRCATAGEFVICRPDRRLVQEDLPELQP